MSDGSAGHTLKVGVLGAGKMGAHHMQAITRVEDGLAELVAVADPAEGARTEAARSFGAAAFADLDAMLEGVPCDVVHICTAPNTHAELAIRALERGSHVYIEKPVAQDESEMRRILDVARARGLRVCAGHQLLFEPPMRHLRQLLPALGRVAHVESFFSFRTVRRAPGGRAPLRADEQLLDILPHPLYLLVDVLQTVSRGEATELVALEVDLRGTVHALVRCGEATGALVVTLEGRPVESYLRVTGRNGVAHADFVRGTVQRLIGPGVSGIDKVLNPYRLSWQLFTGTTVALARRVLRRQRSYPGLAELMSAFYRSILAGSPAPTPEGQLMETVRIWSGVRSRLQARADDAVREAGAPAGGPLVAVTGGTGFLGSAVVERLVAGGHGVRVITRRSPAPWDRKHGVEYVEADLGSKIDPRLFRGVTTVVHCAAETAGGFAEHQRNSVEATANVVEAAASAGVSKVIHISSIAVLASEGGPLSESSPLEADPRAKGPYVWGKLESERAAGEKARELGIDLRIMRPGPIVDADEFDPPGRLGKRIGPVFVCPGMPGGRIATVDRGFAADVIAWAVSHFEEVPETLNLVDADPPTRRRLLERLRRTNPGLRVIWLPRPVLLPLSLVAVAMQKALRPGQRAIHPSRVFADQDVDPRGIQAVRKRMSAGAGNPAPTAAISAVPADSIV